jgi:hypothetical protein
VSYLPPERTAFAGMSHAEQIARAQHEAYERHAFVEFGYLPRLWERLTIADQELRVRVAQELLERGLVVVLPDCPHPSTTLKRIEVRECDVCGSYPLLFENWREDEASEATRRERDAHLYAMRTGERGEEHELLPELRRDSTPSVGTLPAQPGD